MVGQCGRVGLAGVGQMAAVAVLGFVPLTGVSGHFRGCPIEATVCGPTSTTWSQTARWRAPGS